MSSLQKRGTGGNRLQAFVCVVIWMISCFLLCIATLFHTNSTLLPCTQQLNTLGLLLSFNTMPVLID